MGILDALMGHGSEVAAKEVAGKLEGVLLPDETVRLAYRLIRDFFVFTEKRLIIVEMQGILGKKVDDLTSPYRSAASFDDCVTPSQKERAKRCSSSALFLDGSQPV